MIDKLERILTIRRGGTNFMNQRFNPEVDTKVYSGRDFHGGYAVCQSVKSLQEGRGRVSGNLVRTDYWGVALNAKSQRPDQGDPSIDAAKEIKPSSYDVWIPQTPEDAREFTMFLRGIGITQPVTFFPRNYSTPMPKESLGKEIWMNMNPGQAYKLTGSKSNK